MDSEERYIWIEEAVRVYGRSRDWFNRKIRGGRLRRYGMPDGLRVYLDREEIEAQLVIRPIDSPPAPPAG